MFKLVTKLIDQRLMYILIISKQILRRIKIPQSVLRLKNALLMTLIEIPMRKIFGIGAATILYFIA